MTQDALTRDSARPNRRRFGSARILAGSCVLLSTVIASLSGATPAAAQIAPHSTCPSALPSSVNDAKAALERQPADLEARFKLADALVDQGCYSDAVSILEAGQPLHSHSSELSGKLRDVRSMVTEQTYIQGLTQAADAAKLQHYQLRCAKFSDLDACNEALKLTPNDQSLLLAKADALAQRGHADDASVIYQRIVQLNPANESAKAKLAATLARQSASTTASAGNPPVASTESTVPSRAPTRSRAGAGETAVIVESKRPARESARPTAGTASRAVTTPESAQPVIKTAQSLTYSNDAPAAKSN